MVWEHPAQHKNKDVVALATELTNSFLFTGDGAGYLKVWDICQFVNIAKIDQRSNIIELAHWRAHDGCIASLDYVEKHRLILSSSTDTRIKLWRFDSLAENGVTLAGVLGEQMGSLWNLSDVDMFEPVEQEDPPAPTSGAARAPSATTPAEAGNDDLADDEFAPRTGSRAMNRHSSLRGGAVTEEGKNTQDLIHQILTGRGARKGAVSQPTFRALRTHPLAPVSPRGDEVGQTRAGISGKSHTPRDSHR